MRKAWLATATAFLVLVLSGCGTEEGPDTAQGKLVEGAEMEGGGAAPEPAPVAATDASGAGTVKLSFTGEDVSLVGEYPAMQCGGAYILGEGVSYQSQAGDWQITIASEERKSGEVTLNTTDGVNVVATANGPGVQYVRGPRNSGSLTISDDFRRAEADLELRPLLGGAPARLVATFTCDA